VQQQSFCLPASAREGFGQRRIVIQPIAQFTGMAKSAMLSNSTWAPDFSIDGLPEVCSHGGLVRHVGNRSKPDLPRTLHMLGLPHAEQALRVFQQSAFMKSKAQYALKPWINTTLCPSSA
jgi:hypothetical protein